MLLLVILMVPHTSASTCFSGPESIFVRLKILVFGEFSLLNHLPYDHSYNQSDLGLFLFDVGSDIYNGKTFIDDGNPAWGSIILGVIFIPMTLYYLGNARRQYREEETRCQKGLKLFFLIIFAAPLIPMMTVVYIGYVALVFATKCVMPRYIDDTDGNNISTAGSLKLIEAVGEANLQAELGSFISLLKNL